MHPILYSETVIGPHMPNLTYLTPCLPAWPRARKPGTPLPRIPSGSRSGRNPSMPTGQISSVIQISLFRAASYSPVR